MRVMASINSFSPPASGCRGKISLCACWVEVAHGDPAERTLLERNKVLPTRLFLHRQGVIVGLNAAAGGVARNVARLCGARAVAAGGL